MVQGVAKTKLMFAEMVEGIAETNVMLAETSGEAAEIVRMPAAMALERSLNGHPFSRPSHIRHGVTPFLDRGRSLFRRHSRQFGDAVREFRNGLQDFRPLAGAFSLDPNCFSEPPRVNSPRAWFQDGPPPFQEAVGRVHRCHAAFQLWCASFRVAPTVPPTARAPFRLPAPAFQNPRARVQRRPARIQRRPRPI